MVWNNNGARAASTSAGNEPTRDDEELISRVVGHDSEALTALYHRFSRIVLAVGYRILHDRGEAEEVLQDVFFQVFQKAGLFDPSKGSAKNWIVQIAYRRSLDRRTYLNRRGFYVSDKINGLDDTLIGQIDLDRELGAKIQRAQLEKAFEELPEMQRRTLELFYFEGIELSEIVEKLNEPLGNIRHHFYRGLERLRKSAFVQKLRER